MTRSYPDFLKRLKAIGLHDAIEMRALKKYVSLRSLYEGPDMATSVIAARKDVYRWLVKRGRSVNEVARLFDRAPNGVWKMTRGKT